MSALYVEEEISEKELKVLDIGVRNLKNSEKK